MFTDTSYFPAGNDACHHQGTAYLFNEFLWAGGMAVLTQCYSMKGLEVIAGLNISNAICNLLNVVFIAMGNAVGIIMGQFLSASNLRKQRKMPISLCGLQLCFVWD